MSTTKSLVGRLRATANYGPMAWCGEAADRLEELGAKLKAARAYAQRMEQRLVEIARGDPK